MSLFDKLREPILLKETNNTETQIEKLKELLPTVNEKGQKIIEQDIKYLEYGTIGEKNIIFELKNSHMPMYILQDIYLEDGGLNAQIDFIVVTKKITFVIECKNLYGNIEINNQGDFIRIISQGRNSKKEGIYSPVTQNQRHIELIKKIKLDNEQNKLIKLSMKNNFDNALQSIIVLANPKTILNTKYANKELSKKVIRCDQLVNYIKEIYKQSKEPECNDNKLLQRAQLYLTINKNNSKNYTLKYDSYKSDHKVLINEVQKITTATKKAVKPQKENDIYNDLKNYRLTKSRKEKIKPYLIFNDKQLNEIISKMPKKNEELISISGFGKIKIEKYGKEIFEILKKYYQ